MSEQFLAEMGNAFFSIQIVFSIFYFYWDIQENIVKGAQEIQIWLQRNWSRDWIHTSMEKPQFGNDNANNTNTMSNN